MLLPVALFVAASFAGLWSRSRYGLYASALLVLVHAAVVVPFEPLGEDTRGELLVISALFLYAPLLSGALLGLWLRGSFSRSGRAP